MIRIVLPRVTQSLNVTHRQHWAVRKKERLAWAKLLCAHLREAKATIAVSKRRLTIERYSRGTLDQDNFFGGAKDLIDEIKKAKMLIDDTPQWMELVCTQHKPKRHEDPYTIIILTEIK